MRQVRRFLARARRGMRIKLRPPWRRALIAGAACGVIGGAAVGAGWWSVRGGYGDRLPEQALALSAAVGLVVREVITEGRALTGREDLLTSLAVFAGEPILGVDTATAKSRLERLPWVQSVSVTRLLPDTLHIRLVERRPLALWQRHGSFVLIDGRGRVIEGNHVQRFANLPIIVGPDAPAHAAALFADLSVEPTLLRRVRGASRIGGRRWNLYLDDDVEVRLPAGNGEAAWRRLAAAERSAGLLERAVSVIDLRQPDRLVLRLTPEALPPHLQEMGI